MRVTTSYKGVETVYLALWLTNMSTKKGVEKDELKRVIEIIREVAFLPHKLFTHFYRQYRGQFDL